MVVDLTKVVKGEPRTTFRLNSNTSGTEINTERGHLKIRFPCSAVGMNVVN